MKKIITVIVLCASLSACAPQVQLSEQGKRYVMEWLAQNPWYNQHGSESDSRTAFMLDQQLREEGGNPETQAYWDELTRRVMVALPHRFIKSTDSNAGLNGSKDPWCGGYKPKTAKYKKCIADREKEIVDRQREASIEQPQLQQQAQTKRPDCEVYVRDMAAWKAGSAALAASELPDARAHGIAGLKEANAIEQKNALCRGDTQGYYQLRQLEIQEQQLELQRQQLRQQRNQIMPPPSSSDMRCQPNGFGGYDCRQR